MVGFEIPEGAEVSYRTSADGDAWSSWEWARALEVDDGPDPGSDEAAQAEEIGTRSDGLWVGDASWLQIRVLNGDPADVGVDLIDSMGLSRSVLGRAADAIRTAWRSEPDQAEAAPAAPTVVSRSQWGANESWRRGDPRYADEARFGVVHHTAGGNGYTRAEAPGVVRGIYRYHTQSLGWADVGYNLLIDRYGTVYEGRHGGLERPVVGAHASGYNTGSVGVSVMGNFEEGSLPQAARTALVQTLAWQYDVHSIDMDGRTTYNGESIPTMVGHRDVGRTACPGRHLYAQLPQIRRDVLARQDAQGGVILDPSVSPRSAELRRGVLDEEVRFGSRLRSGAEWNLTVRNPDGVVVHEASGSGTSASSIWNGGQHLKPGTYRFTFSSPDRRSATRTFRLEQSCEQGDLFCDIDPDGVHSRAIEGLAERGVIRGCADQRFCPADSVRRGQMATFIAGALGLEPSGTNHFRDVPATYPHRDAINALADRGFALGDGDRFHPNDFVTRGQMASFLARSLGLQSNGGTYFFDVAGDAHESSINALAEAGIAEGSNGRYHPRADIRRDQAASLIWRATADVED
jgi:hypothetical protein